MKPRRFLFNLQTMLLVKAGRQHHTKENLSLALRDLILTVMEVQESPTDVSYQR